MAEQKAIPKHVNEESDLEKLAVGNLVKVSLDCGETRKWIVYGGKNGEEESFLEKVGEDIFEWSSGRKYLGFDKGCILFNAFHLSLTEYTPSSNPQEYLTRKEILESVGL